MHDHIAAGLHNGNLAPFLGTPRPGWSAVRWLVVDGVSGDVLRLLGDAFQLHPLALEDSLSMQRTKAVAYPGHLHTTPHLWSIRRPQRRLPKKDSTAVQQPPPPSRQQQQQQWAQLSRPADWRSSALPASMRDGGGGSGISTPSDVSSAGEGEGDSDGSSFDGADMAGWQAASVDAGLDNAAGGVVWSEPQWQGGSQPAAAGVPPLHTSGAAPATPLQPRLVHAVRSRPFYTHIAEANGRDSKHQVVRQQVRAACTASIICAAAHAKTRCCCCCCAYCQVSVFLHHSGVVICIFAGQLAGGGDAAAQVRGWVHLLAGGVRQCVCMPLSHGSHSAGVRPAAGQHSRHVVAAV